MIIYCNDDSFFLCECRDDDEDEPDEDDVELFESDDELDEDE